MTFSFFTFEIEYPIKKVNDKEEEHKEVNTIVSVVEVQEVWSWSTMFLICESSYHFCTSAWYFNIYYTCILFVF